MKAKDVMTADVVTVAQDASVHEAIRLMLQRKISGLPVVDKSGTLVGMVTEGDFLRRSELGTERHAPRWIEFLVGPGKLAENYVHAAGRKVRDVMTDKVQAVDEDAPLNEVVETMERRHIKRVPVLRGGKLAGIVTRANLLHALAGMQRSDASISHRPHDSDQADGGTEEAAMVAAGRDRHRRDRWRRQAVGRDLR